MDSVFVISQPQNPNFFFFALAVWSDAAIQHRYCLSSLAKHKLSSLDRVHRIASKVTGTEYLLTRRCNIKHLSSARIVLALS